MKISFVIPCYYAAKNIGSVVEEIRQTMDARTEFEYEIVLVNDGSTDETASVIKQMALEDSRITAVDLAKNMGQPNALLAGLHFASGDVVMTSDDDGQTPIGRVFEFLEELEKGYDVVCARYVKRHQPSLFRRLGSALNRRMSDWLIEKPKGVYMAAIFMARKFVVREMIKYPHSYPYISGLILRITQNVGNVDVEQRERAGGESGYTFTKLIKLWINGFTAFSVKPLRLATGIGFSFSFIGFLWALVTIIRKLLTPSMSAGWSSLMAVLLFVGGILLLFMGLLGEYVGRIYMCINQSPQFVVKEVTRKKEE